VAQLLRDIFHYQGTFVVQCAVYNRAQYLDERRRMMQSRADYPEGLKAGGLVVPFRNTG